MRKTLGALALLMCLQPLSAQKDSIPYYRGFPITPGVYLSFDDFKRNEPVGKSRIISDAYARTDPAFITKTVSKNIITYYDDSGKVRSVKRHDIWGFSNAHSVYVNWKSDFIKLPVLAAISVFSDPNSASTSDPYIYPSSLDYNEFGNDQFFLDFATGTFHAFHRKELEQVFRRDKRLFNEYKNYKGRKKEKLYIFMHKFNRLHPIYFYQ